MTERIALSLAPPVCLGCAQPLTGPHDECVVAEHEAAMAGDVLAKDLHDEEECPLCLEGRECRSQCRCGCCCERLIIEASAFDALREPLIKERGSIIIDDPSLPLEVADWLLNSRTGPCVFFHRGSDGHGVCEIYATRPLGCRLFDCDQAKADGTLAD